MLINRISGLLFLIQIFCIAGVPHRFVDVEDNKPTFFRGSVEHVPLDDGMKGSLRDGAEEDEMLFSRAAVESIPTTKLSYFQPLRSAVEHNPLDDEEDDFSMSFSQKENFLRIVNPKRRRKSKALNLEAYVIPTQQANKPQRYRSGSPYQELVDPKTFENQQLDKIQEMKLKVFEQKRVKPRCVCHITNWSFYRKGEGKFVPENLEPSLCTEIIYSFATLDPEAYEMREFDPWGDIENQLYSRTVNLDTNVPVLLGMGGWTDSNGDKYTRLVSDSRKRQNFITRAIVFLRQYGFSGLHVDWNYPHCWQSDCRAGPDSDRDDFTKLIQELSKAFKPYNLILSSSVSGYKEIIVKAYDLKALSDAVDFMTVMTYDYHGSWESVTGHVSPLYGDANDKYPQYNTDYAMKLLVKLGADKEKLIMGVPFYGQTFMLSTTRQGQGFNSPADGPGEPGEVTNQPGMLAYNEICNRLRRPGWKLGKDTTSKAGPYASDSSQWVGFDDVTTIMMKTKYAMNAGYGGIAAWTVDLDDFSNRCCLEPFPLLRAINRALGRLDTPIPSGNNCKRPPTPVTPVPPLMVATVDTGAAGIPVTGSGADTPSTTTSSWWNPSTTTSSWWNPSTTSSTTRRTTRKTTEPSTTSTWWSSTTTTTKRSTRRTTQRTTTAPASSEDTTIPVPINVMPVTVEGECQPGDFKPSSKCNEYLICSNTGLLVQYCPAGLHWNREGNFCDWPAGAKCVESNNSEPTEKPSTTRRPVNTRRTTQTTPATTYKPSNTRRTTTTTEAATTTTRPTTTRRSTTTTRATTTRRATTGVYADYTTTNRPDYETTTDYITTSSKRPNKQPCVNGEYYAHKDCRKYYICNNGKRTASHCPEGTQWSKEMKTCDFEANVKCVSKKKYLKLLKQQYEKSGIYTASLLKAVEGDPCDAARNFLPYPGVCSHYLQCDQATLIDRECPPSLYFDPAQSVCNWPDQVDCKNDESLSANDEENDEEYEYYDDDEVEQTNEVSNQIPDFTFDEGSPKPSSTSTTTRRPSSTTTRRPSSSSPKPPSAALEIIPVSENVKPLRGPFKLVCYFTNWAWYRPGDGKYLPNDINENLCTHIVYGFAVLNYDELTIKSHDSWADTDNKFYERVVEFKQRGVRVTLAIGGWNDSLGDKYSRLVSSPAARARFIKHVIEFLEKYGFEGLDLDWEYPVCWQVDCTKGRPDEKQNFAALVRELSEAFRPRGLLLSSAVSPSKTVIDAGYDVPTLAKYFDWIAVMCYDYHGQWDKKTGHVAPLYHHPQDEVDYLNSDYTMRYWIKLGAPASKLVMGMPLYGQSFTLADPMNHGLNAKAPGPGQAGEFTRAAGFLAYYEICDRIFNRGWTVVQDTQGRLGPYAYKGNQWVSFDDQATLRRKTKFIKELGLGGGMIWALDLDDFKNKCGQGSHPLLKVIHAELQNSDSTGAPSPENPVQIPDEEYEDDDDNNLDGADSHKEPIEPHDPVPDVDIDANNGNNESDEEYYDEEFETNEIDVDSEKSFKVVCYYTNWAWYRPGVGKFVPEDIDARLCTHIVYGFAVLNRDTLVIQPHDSWADIDNRFYERVVEYKRKGVKVTMAIGGWNDSAGDKYSRLVRNAASRARFVKHVIEFIEKYGFDGLDLDWEYPVCWQVDCTKGSADEKKFFAMFVEELSKAFKPRGLLLSTAVSPSKKVIDAGYDIPKLTRYFDWISVMAYDYHGQWDKKTGHVAPMYVHPEDWDQTFNANFSINYWIEQGADPSKIIMGMPMYGQSFSLAERTNTGLNSMTYGGGEAGPETRARGFLAYYEICQNIRNKNWNVVRDLKGRIGPYAYSGDQWVSFDDAPMIRHKSEFVKALGLGGAMIWALDLDDFKNVCGCEEYPLLRTINRVLRQFPGPHNSCVLEAKKSRPGTEVTTKKPVPTTKRTTSPKPTTKMTMKPEVLTRKPSSARPTSTRTSTARPTTARPQKSTTTTQVPSLDDYPSLDEDKTCTGDNQFMKHETDCNKYYQCDHGVALERQCSPGLHWAEDRCNWPDSSKCVSVSSDTGNEGEEGDYEDIEDGDENEVDYVPSKKPSTQRPTTARPTTSTAMTSPRPTRPPVPDSPVVLTGNEKFMCVCYFTNWAWYRPGIGKYRPGDIDANLCTHIVYGFAVLNGETLTIRTHDSWADLDNNFYGKVAEYKEKGIKVTVAIGGWNDSLGDKYSRLVRDPAARARFIKHVVDFIKKYGFQGLDLDWEYPKCWQVDCDKGKAEEKEWFADFVQELSEAFKPEGLLLSAAVSPSKKVIDAGYDIPKLSKYFDWIAVMCYDYHGQWDKKTGHVAPLYVHPEDWETTFNANFSIRYWISKGAPPKKLVMGMPMYGQSFSLEKTSNHDLNAVAPGPGQAGEFTRAAGFLAFYEICDRVNRGGWTVVRDPEGRIGPYAYKDRQWVSYDDVEDIRRKTKFVKDLGLGGAMIWALDLDDFRNRCGCGSHPLLSTINLELGRISTARRSDCT